MHQFLFLFFFALFFVYIQRLAGYVIFFSKILITLHQYATVGERIYITHVILTSTGTRINYLIAGVDINGKGCN